MLRAVLVALILTVGLAKQGFYELIIVVWIAAAISGIVYEIRTAEFEPADTDSECARIPNKDLRDD